MVQENGKTLMNTLGVSWLKRNNLCGRGPAKIGYTFDDRNDVIYLFDADEETVRLR